MKALRSMSVVAILALALIGCGNSSKSDIDSVSGQVSATNVESTIEQQSTSPENQTGGVTAGSGGGTGGTQSTPGSSNSNQPTNGSSSGAGAGGATEPSGSEPAIQNTAGQNTAGQSNTVTATPADPGVRPAIPAIPGHAKGNPGGPSDDPPVDPPELCADGTLAPCDTFTGEMLVATRSGVMLVDSGGHATTFYSGIARHIEVLNGRIFALISKEIHELDRSGNLINVVRISTSAYYYFNFTALPDGRFALYDNVRDVVHFIKPNGDFIATVKVRDFRSYSAQCMRGIVYGNKLIVSHDGGNKLVQIDLNNYTLSTYMDLSTLGVFWVNEIRFYDGLFYLTSPQKVFTFPDNQWPEFLFTTNEINITGLLVSDDSVFVAVNFSGKIYRYDRLTGVIETFSTGINYPTDIEEF